MRILVVSGIMNLPGLYSNWEKDLQCAFPDAEIVIFENFYHHFDENIMAALITQGKAILEDNKPTIILAHSFGGMLAKVMISESKHHRVLYLATMASPHTMRIGGVEKAIQKLSVPASVSVPFHTYGGYLDALVPFTKTKIVDAHHKNLWCDHFAFLFSRKIRHKIIEDTQAFLRKNTK